MRKILIVGGGYAGFYTAKKLEKWLRRGEAQVTMVDPLPYMTYQPFLPEVAAGSIEPRHAVIAHRRHLKKTRVITAAVMTFVFLRCLRCATTAWRGSIDPAAISGRKG